MDALRIAQVAALASATAAILVLGYETLTLGEQLKFTANSFNSVPANVNKTLDRLNKPGTGTLAELDKVILATKSLEVHADIVIAHENKQLTVLDAQEAQLFADLHQTAISAQQTTNALAGTAKAATTALGTVNESIVPIKPLLEASTRTMNSTNALISNPDIPKTIANVQGITFQGNRVAKDAADEADLLMKPQPLWKKLIPGAELAAKFYACAFQHVCLD